MLTNLSQSIQEQRRHWQAEETRPIAIPGVGNQLITLARWRWQLLERIAMGDVPGLIAHYWELTTIRSTVGPEHQATLLRLMIEKHVNRWHVPPAWQDGPGEYRREPANENEANDPVHRILYGFPLRQAGWRHPREDGL